MHLTAFNCICIKHLNNQKYNKDEANRWSFLTQRHYSDVKLCITFSPSLLTSSPFLFKHWQDTVCMFVGLLQPDKKSQKTLTSISDRILHYEQRSDAHLCSAHIEGMYWQEQRLHCGHRSVSSLAVFTEEGGTYSCQQRWHRGAATSKRGQKKNPSMYQRKIRGSFKTPLHLHW